MQPADHATTAPMIDVVIVDDSPVLRRKVHEALQGQSDLRLVAEGVDVSALDQILANHHVDVAVVDVDTNVTDVMHALRSIATCFDGTKFLLASEYPQEWPLSRVAHSRAVGLLDKQSLHTELVPGVRAAVQGLFVSSSLRTTKDEVITLPSDRKINLQDTPESVLTDRELEVLALMAEGLGNREIGNHLFISENTVKNHVRSILEKLNQHTRMAAVIYAVRQRILHIT